MKNIELGMAAAAKIGSILVHAEEAIEDGHVFDVIVMKSMLADRDVQTFIELLRGYALVPVKRK